MRRIIPLHNCRSHRIIEKDVVVYGYRVHVRWSGEDFGDCSDVLFFPEALDYSVFFAPSNRLPVVVAVLYSRPDIVRSVRAFVVEDTNTFIECLFNYGEIIARDVVALDYIPKTKELLEKASKELPIGPTYVVDVDGLFEDLLEATHKLCGSHRKHVESIALGPEIEKLEKAKRNNLIYGVSGQFMYLHDGFNHVFIDVRSIDPFEIGEENIVIVYGIYGGREEAYAAYIGEEIIDEDELRNLLDMDILREDNKLKAPQSIAKQLLELISKHEQEEE
ncbi:hypothetical protein [Thermofilum sp.]|uniref:hypothetical protein n=1 Tax=Thermofilum sp. TaxID=1961369 RepID=UPI0031637C13